MLSDNITILHMQSAVLKCIKQKKGANKNLCIDNAAFGHEKWVGNLGLILFMSPKLTKVKPAPPCTWSFLFIQKWSELETTLKIIQFQCST